MSSTIPAINTMPHSLHVTRIDEVVARVAQCTAIADAYDGAGVWIHRCTTTELDRQINRLDGMIAQGLSLPLLGYVMAVKDNIDVAGLPTTAACPAFSYTPQVSATVVQKLCDAGAVLLGKTNMDQFATGLVGTRSPYGACENFHNRKYISGGSSSGSAVAVAAGMCDFSLGTDTAGSGRVPAMFNGIIGLKPTRGLLSLAGVVPACRSLDCVSIFAKQIDLANQVMRIAEGFDPLDIYSRKPGEITTTYSGTFPNGVRFGVPASDDLEFFGNDGARALFATAINRLAHVGHQRVQIDFGSFIQAAQLLYDGPWIAERLAAIHEFYSSHADQMLPVTRNIIAQAEKLTAVDTFGGMYQLAACRRQTRDQWVNMDVLVLPTAGTCYTIEQVNADPVQLNKNLGYYTNFVNLLDLCALAIPAGVMKETGVPFGITLVAPAGNEQTLAEVAKSFAGEAL